MVRQPCWTVRHDEAERAGRADEGVSRVHGLVQIADEVREHPERLARRERLRRATEDADALARDLDDVGGPRAGERHVVLRGLERDVRVVIGILRRVLEPEERRVAILVERILDGVGPDARVGERLLRPKDLPHLGQRPRALQMQLGHASDNAVAGVAKSAERRAERHDRGEAEEWASERVIHEWTLLWMGSGAQGSGKTFE